MQQRLPPKRPHHHQVKTVVTSAEREREEVVSLSAPSPCRSRERRYHAQLLGTSQVYPTISNDPQRRGRKSKIHHTAALIRVCSYARNFPEQGTTRKGTTVVLVALPTSDRYLFPALSRGAIRTQDLRQRLATAAGVDSKGAAIKGCRPAHALLLVRATNRTLQQYVDPSAKPGQKKGLVWRNGRFVFCNERRRKPRSIVI